MLLPPYEYYSSRNALTSKIAGKKAAFTLFAPQKARRPKAGDSPCYPTPPPSNKIGGMSKLAHNLRRNHRRNDNCGYGHTTTTMHYMSTHPLLLAKSRASRSFYTSCAEISATAILAMVLWLWSYHYDRAWHEYTPSHASKPTGQTESFYIICTENSATAMATPGGRPYPHPFSPGAPPRKKCVTSHNSGQSTEGGQQMSTPPPSPLLSAKKSAANGKASTQPPPQTARQQPRPRKAGRHRAPSCPHSRWFRGWSSRPTLPRSARSPRESTAEYPW